MMELEHIVEKIKAFDNIQFVILHGSFAEGRMTEGSDIDLCVGFDGSEEEASRARFEISSELFDDWYDVQVFQLLPLYVRKEVLKGDVLYRRDKQELYDIAYETIREFDDFKHRYYDYIGKEAMA